MKRFIDALVVAAALVALASGVLALRRILADPVAVAGQNVAPVRLDAEQMVAVNDHGRLLIAADSTPSVRIVYFTDYECRYCQRFDLETLPTLQARFPGRLEIVVRNWPLPGHRFAYPSARAANCAGRQDRFPQFHAELVRTQDSLGLIPFRVLAANAGVDDLQAFELCAGDSSPMADVEADLRLAREIGGLGTPLIVVGDLLFPAAPHQEDLIDAIVAALDI